MPRGPSPRIEKRRALERERIVAAAAVRFAQNGPDGVALEEIGAEADVSRGTFYGHFPSKDSLLYAIVAPLLEAGGRALVEAPAAGDALSALHRVCDVYWALHSAHPQAMRVAYKVQGKPLASLGPAHGSFLRGVLALFRVMHAEGRLATGDPVLAARLISTVGVPVLELYAGQPEAEARFRHTMRALLLAPKPRGGVRAPLR